MSMGRSLSGVSWVPSGSEGLGAQGLGCSPKTQQASLSSMKTQSCSPIRHSSSMHVATSEPGPEWLLAWGKSSLAQKLEWVGPEVMERGYFPSSFGSFNVTVSLRL